MITGPGLIKDTLFSTVPSNSNSDNNFNYKGNKVLVLGSMYTFKFKIQFSFFVIDNNTMYSKSQKTIFLI